MDADALYQDVFDKYAKHINPNLARLMGFAGFGIETYGEGCYIFDHEGRKYLDCLGGYGTFALGHRNPRVIAAIKDQLDHLGLSAKAFFYSECSGFGSQASRADSGGFAGFVF